MRTLIGRLSHVPYTVEGTWRPLKRHDWSWQQPTRRAVVHTDDDFFQTVTRGPRTSDRTRRTVRFDDLLEIPSDCFVDRTLAIDTVSLWMTEDALPPAAGFSDDLFG